MPLSPAASRKRLHERNARYEGFARDDELFDFEAHLTDVKVHETTSDAARRYYPRWYRGAA